MITFGAALPQVPKVAVVPTHVIDGVERALAEHEDNLQEFLDREYRDFERIQPVLSKWLAEQLVWVTEELVQSLGYFLTITVYMCFRDAFHGSLRVVDDETIEYADALLATDEELRRQGRSPGIRSDAIVAMGQPAVLGLVQRHLEHAIEQAEVDIDRGDLDHIYRTAQLEVVALTRSVHVLGHSATMPH